MVVCNIMYYCLLYIRLIIMNNPCKFICCTHYNNYCCYLIFYKSVIIFFFFSYKRVVFRAAKHVLIMTEGKKGKVHRILQSLKELIIMYLENRT